jgi:lysophospholipase L1-like esterase
MKFKLMLLTLLLPLFASAQITPAQDTTLIAGSTPYTPQNRFVNVTLSGTNYRIMQTFNSLLGKYDTWVTSKYLRAFYAPLTGGGYAPTFTVTAPITYSSNVIGITQSDATHSGYLSLTDWGAFNNKEAPITAGTTLQYWRGDKTFQTLNTAIVPELTNLYYTDVRSRNALSFAAGSGAYNSTTGVITIPTNNNQIANGAGYGAGSVTSITPGYGFTSSTPITSSGTLTIDSTKLQTVTGLKNTSMTLYRKTLQDTYTKIWDGTRGIKIGGSSLFGGGMIWDASVGTPSDTNFSLMTQSGSTTLNSTGNMYFAQNGTSYGELNNIGFAVDGVLEATSYPTGTAGTERLLVQGTSGGNFGSPIKSISPTYYKASADSGSIANNYVTYGKYLYGVDMFKNKSISGAFNTFTNIPLATAVSGILPVANGGTNTNTAGIGAINNITGRSYTGFTGTGNLAGSASPTFTGTVGAAAITASGAVTAGSNLIVKGSFGNFIFQNASGVNQYYFQYNRSGSDNDFGLSAPGGTGGYVWYYNSSGAHYLTSLNPDVTNSYDLGSSSFAWRNAYATTFNGALNGTINSTTTGITQSAGDNSTKMATTGYVDNGLSGKAAVNSTTNIGTTSHPLNRSSGSEALTGVTFPTAPIANDMPIRWQDTTTYIKYRYANPQKVHQVYSMGNSLTANGIYSQKLDTLLGSKWYVVNKGIQGQTTTDMLARFTTDITSHADCEYVTILGGINDVIAGSTALTIESNLQAMYTAAHNASIKVVGITLLPFKGNVNWTSGKQAVVDSVNTWIKNTATNVDYKVDDYAVFNDPAHPGMMLPQYYGTSPDYLHPNLAGYLFLGTTIYNNVIWTPNNTVVTLGISSNTSINQNLRTNDAPTFRDLNLVAQQPSYGGGVFGGGNLYMPSSTATTGIIYNNLVPVIQFPGTGNVQVGYSDVSASGNYNFKGGHEAGNSIGSGSFNTAVGSFAFYGRSTADLGLAAGYQAGFSNNALRSVFLGPQAGYYETGGSKLFIDNQQRASEADGRVKALIYGVFDASPSVQELHFNAKTFVNGNFLATNLYSTSATPSISAGAGAGTSPTLGISGTNQDGIITITVGTLPSAGSKVMTVTMSGGFAYPSTCVPILTYNGAPVNNHVYITNVNATSFEVWSDPTGLTAGLSYQFYYHNGGF